MELVAITYQMYRSVCFLGLHRSHLLLSSQPHPILKLHSQDSAFGKAVRTSGWFVSTAPPTCLCGRGGEDVLHSPAGPEGGWSSCLDCLFQALLPTWEPWRSKPSGQHCVPHASSRVFLDFDKGPCFPVFGPP